MKIKLFPPQNETESSNFLMHWLQAGRKLPPPTILLLNIFSIALQMAFVGRSYDSHEEQGGAPRWILIADTSQRDAFLPLLPINKRSLWSPELGLLHITPCITTFPHLILLILLPFGYHLLSVWVKREANWGGVQGFEKKALVTQGWWSPERRKRPSLNSLITHLKRAPDEVTMPCHESLCKIYVKNQE